MTGNGVLGRSCALFLVLSSAAFAQDGEDAADTIIVIGGRIPVSAQDVTSAVSVIERADIELRGGLSLADTLRAVPGVAVSRSGGAGALTDLRLRGSEANHTLVLIDGIEASVPLTGGYDFAHLPGFGVASVEILRGEQSALWGADAIGGVINIRTVDPDAPASGLAQFELGSFGTRFAAARASGEDGRLSGGLAASSLESDGIDVSGAGSENDGYSRFFASTAGRFALGEDESIQWAARFADFESEFDSDSDFNGLLDNTNDSAAGRQAAIGARLTLARGGLRHDLAASLTTDRLASFSDAAFVRETEAERLQAFYQFTRDWQAGGTTHRLTGLAEASRETFASFAGAGAASNQSQEIETASAALDYQFRRGALRLSASARHDWNERFQDAATWRIGGAWVFDSIGGRLRASFGEGVKTPGVYELFGFFPGFFVGNPDLQPERSLGWEVGWDQGFGDIARFSLSWFEAELTDEIFTDFAVFPFTARNRTGESRRAGLELGGAISLPASLALSGTATLLDAEENGVPELRRPETTGSLALDWQSRSGRWQASLAADYTGEQRDTDFGTFSTVTLPAYTLLSARAAWQVRETVQLYVRGTNLTDEEAIDVFGYASEGRGLFLGLRLGG
ncbi:TonB-dependent receptor plug domain-containing protein [Hyphobacterium sp.]|uniref:TonB-dependent receptor plug domain-containing protein n=1 Tax=Hyphobacterium sp. TaxID=2004662 RepID=UPI003B52815C